MEEKNNPFADSTEQDRKRSLYQQWGLSLDLALEAHDLLRGDHGGEIPGVKLTEEHEPLATIKTVTILNQQGSRIMQKPIGTYITISSEHFTFNHRSVHQQLAALIAKQLQQVIKLQDLNQTVLVVGLGNWKSTPDSLGPRLVNKMMATRHLHGNVPKEVVEGVRPVCTLAPGVLGLTGIETAEIIKGVVDKVKPALIVAFDALAAGDASRIGTTIQISNTGINPGSGVGNQRPGVNQQTMGVPVIAVGIPTVVKAKIIAHNVLEAFLHELNNRPQLQQLVKALPEPLLHSIINNILQPYQNNLEVTPKEIDDLIHNCASILADSLTQVLHPDMNEDFANCFI